MINYVASVLGVLVTISSTQASDIIFTASLGSSTYAYDYSYPYQDYNGDDATLQFDEEIDFGYQDYTISFSDDGESTFTLKWGGLPRETNYSSSYDESSAERDELSLTLTRRTDANWSWFVGYYESEANLSQTIEEEILGIDYQFEFETIIDTGGIFGGVTYNDFLSDKWLWFSRAAVQLNWANFKDNYKWENENDQTGYEPFSRDLTGVAILFGAGLYYPVSDYLGIVFGFEHKTYDYDNETEYLYEDPTTLSEDQTTFMISISTRL